MLFWARESMVSIAVWSRALSCWNISAVEITFRPCLRTGRWMIWRWKRYGVGRNIQQPQSKFSACSRQFNRSML
jgi:hypothetical protein